MSAEACQEKISAHIFVYITLDLYGGGGGGNEFEETCLNYLMCSHILL